MLFSFSEMLVSTRFNENIAVYYKEVLYFIDFRHRFNENNTYICLRKRATDGKVRINFVCPNIV
mgnify:CR=1 FL=1